MKSQQIFRIILAFVLPLVAAQNAYSQTDSDDKVRKGTIKGRVIDREAKDPLSGANIIVAGTKMGVVADQEGNFTINEVPVGSYVLRFSHTGYEPLSATDIIVKSGRITSVQSELKMTVFEIEGIIVEAGYFSQTEEQPTSAINFSGEEIRRAPGSAGDVSRIIMGLPSIAKVNDSHNSLIVRGGSPTENSFFVDNIEIPNINHFPSQGSSGGPIGLLNVDFIKDVNFYTGGFSAIYGDKLSSIMDLSFREGNRDEFDIQMDLNFAGLGSVAEGPLGNGNGAWLFSARRSFLDLLVDAIGTEAGSVPEYSDYQGKLVYDLSANHKITILNILGRDRIITDRDDAIEDKENMYGDVKITENTAGLNWQYLWKGNGYSNTSISHSFTKHDWSFFETRNDNELFENRSLEQEFKLRNVNFYRINPSNRLEFGVEVKLLRAEYDNFYSQYNDPLGNITPAFRLDEEISSQKYAGFVNYNFKPFKRLILTPGIRADYFEFNGTAHLAPRLSFSFQLGEKTSLNGATGIFYQNLPMILLSQQEAYKDLKNPVSVHYVLGINQLLNENTRLTIEGYHKEYDHFPLNPTQPSLFIMDQIVYQGIFLNHERLVDSGKAYSRGIEVLIQKKLAKDVYGLISGSYFRSRYKDLDGVWRDRLYDNRYMFTAEGGYKPNNKWEFSMRWIFAGGAPYTPLDIDASQTIGRGVFDENNINGDRLPAYHSLNVRFDRRFHFTGSNLILYFSVWNAYGRKNISSYTWNEIDNEQDEMEQWSFLPVFGLEWEF